MEEQIQLKLTTRTSNVILGKIVLLLLFSVMTGYLMAKDDEEDYKAGKILTREAYMANFENYKAEQTGSEPVPRVVGIIIMGVLVFAFFGIYELLGIGFGRVISMINKLAYPPDIHQDYHQR